MFLIGYTSLKVLCVKVMMLFVREYFFACDFLADCAKVSSVCLPKLVTSVENWWLYPDNFWDIMFLNDCKQYLIPSIVYFSYVSSPSGVFTKVPD